MIDEKKTELDEVIKRVLEENSDEVQKYKAYEDGVFSSLLAKVFSTYAINGDNFCSFEVFEHLKDCLGPRNEPEVKTANFIKVGVIPEYLESLESLKDAIAAEKFKLENFPFSNISKVFQNNEEREKRTAGFWKRAEIDPKKYEKIIPPPLTKEIVVERTPEEKLTGLFEKHNNLILDHKQLRFMDDYFKTLLRTCEFDAVDFADVTEKTKSKLEHLKKEHKPIQAVFETPKTDNVVDAFDKYYAESKVKILQLENNCEELKTNYSDNLVGYSVYLQNLLKAERVMNRLENLRAALAMDPPLPEVLEQAKSYLIEKNKFNIEKVLDLKTQLDQLFANKRF